MIVTGKSLSRRSLLRGLGASVALPFLDAMSPALAASSRRAATPCRLVFAYVPNGIHMPAWTPEAEGRAFTLPATLEPLAPFREQILVLSGLTHNTGRALGDGPGDHARAAASYLTGVHPKKTAGANIQGGVSVDQVAAARLGGATRLPSLELACEDGRLVGNCDSGYSCAYSNTISWRSATTPVPPEVNPRLVFERMFGSADAPHDPAARARRLSTRKSILDFVASDTEQLKRELGPSDRRKVDEYLEAVRDIERRIEAAERQAPETVPDMEAPAGVPVEFQQHVALMFDLMAVALETDSTRIATFMISREGSSRAYRELGISDGHHPLSHHRNDPAMMEKIARINRFHIELFTRFVARLASVKDGEGSLLDNSVVVYGSGLSDGNRHLHHDLPVLIAGRGCGRLTSGRHVRYPKDTPMTNLYLSLLDTGGVKVESLGDSNGRLELLSL